MSTGSEAADQMARETLQIAEVAVKLSAMGFKESLQWAMAYAKENPKVRGKTNLDRLLRDGKELKVMSIQKKDLKKFEHYAQHYGVLFSAIKDKSGQGENIDIMFKAEDAGKLNRIYEQMGYMIFKQGRGERKKAPTRHPFASGSRMRGKAIETPSGKFQESRPSVKAAIQRLKAAAKAAEQAQDQIRQNTTPNREER